MDRRIRSRIESDSGLPIEAFPPEGIALSKSPRRTDEPGNRLLIQRIASSNAVLMTAVPWVLELITSAVGSMSPSEIFSPLGVQELRRALPTGVTQTLPETYGCDYVLIDQSLFRPAATRHTPLALGRKDIPPEQIELRISERRKPVADDFVWAFACYHNDPDAPATELAPFGPRCASIAIVIWGDGSDIATLGVGTEVGYRGQGFAVAVVSAATEWILNQGAVAWYGAYADNIPSLRIARRLGFQLFSQTIGA